MAQQKDEVSITTFWRDLRILEAKLGRAYGQLLELDRTWDLLFFKSQQAINRSRQSLRLLNEEVGKILWPPSYSKRKTSGHFTDSIIHRVAASFIVSLRSVETRAIR
jgi:hypothetical protein